MNWIKFLQCLYYSSLHLYHNWRVIGSIRFAIQLHPKTMIQSPLRSPCSMDDRNTIYGYKARFGVSEFRYVDA